jgi:hypothetical protein
MDIRGNDARGILGASYSGRSVDVETGYFEACRWIAEYQSDRKRQADLETRFLDSIAGYSAVPVDRPVWRGRTFKEAPASWEDFGPPPPSKAPLGRYNARGTPVLYLADSVEGVEVEVPERDARRRWVQRFRLPPDLMILDARGLPHDSFSAGVFWAMESHRAAFPDSWLGVRIAELLRERFDGLWVPGVRGTDERRYGNVVVFAPGENWKSWVDLETPSRIVP